MHLASCLVSRLPRSLGISSLSSFFLCLIPDIYNRLAIRNSSPPILIYVLTCNARNFLILRVIYIVRSFNIALKEPKIQRSCSNRPRVLFISALVLVVSRSQTVSYWSLDYRKTEQAYGLHAREESCDLKSTRTCGCVVLGIALH